MAELVTDINGRTLKVGDRVVLINGELKVEIVFTVIGCSRGGVFLEGVMTRTGRQVDIHRVGYVVRKLEIEELI